MIFIKELLQYNAVFNRFEALIRLISMYNSNYIIARPMSTDVVLTKVNSMTELPYPMRQMSLTLDEKKRIIVCDTFSSKTL